MSLQSKKNLLFGKAGSDIKDLENDASNIRPNIPKTSAVSTVKSVNSGKSAIAVKKMEEGHQFREKGENLLQTSIFKWSADHLAAAPAFEKASSCFQAAGDLELAKNMLLKASYSQQCYDSFASAAVTLSKAAQIALNQDKKEEAADLYVKAADSWAVHGDAGKSGDCYVKAAKCVEEFNSIRAMQLYQKGCDRMCPPEIPKGQMTSISPQAADNLRDYLRFLLKSRKIEEALVLATRMIDVNEALECESSMCKAMLTVTLLQLEKGDVVLADQTFVQEHLSSSQYLRSNECRCAETFIQAFKSMDPEELEKAQASRDLFYLDTEIQSLARGLSLMVYKRNDKKELKPLHASITGKQIINDNNQIRNTTATSQLLNYPGVTEEKQVPAVDTEILDNVEYSWDNDLNNNNNNNINSDELTFIAEKPLLANPPIVSSYVTAANDDDDIDLT